MPETDILWKLGGGSEAGLCHGGPGDAVNWQSQSYFKLDQSLPHHHRPPGPKGVHPASLHHPVQIDPPTPIAASSTELDTGCSCDLHLSTLTTSHLQSHYHVHSLMRAFCPDLFRIFKTQNYTCVKIEYRSVFTLLKKRFSSSGDNVGLENVNSR